MNKLYFSVFFAIFLSIYFIIHYYVYSRIAGGLTLTALSRNYLVFFFFVLGLLFILMEILSRNKVLWAKPIYYIGTIWVGVISIAFTLFLLRDLLFIISCRFCTNYFSTIFVLTVLFLVSLYSVYNGVKNPIIKRIEIQTPKLKESLSGLSIVQLSDLHLNSFKSKEWLDTVVDEANGENPDLIVITGDLIDADLGEFNGFCESLANLKSKYGVFACTGNHEFYAGIDKFLQFAKKSNITVLRNERITVADSIELIGIDDKTGERFSGKGGDLESVMKNSGPEKLIIVLSHQPDIFARDDKFSFDLQLSGHTHAGQIPPMDLLVKLHFKYPYGLYRKDSSYIYTSCGTGIWGPQMRLFSHSEIVKIIIRNK